MITILTGNGKGKTTASLGQALRAVGNSRKVLMVQFIKGPWRSGEDTCALRLDPDFKIVKGGMGFVGIIDDKLPFSTHSEAAEKALEYALEESLSKKWNVLILDEIWNALDLRLIHEDNILHFLKKARPYLEQIILTGRNCPQQFIDMADLVTEMREVKHPFTSGAAAQKAVEF